MPKRPATLKKQLAHEIETSLKAYLRCEDRCSMWHSVESRTPFSSSKALIEFARTLPSSQLVQGNELKHLYRQSIKPFLPEKIYNRKDKLGFTTPNNVWIAQIYPQLLHLFNDICSSFLDTKALLKDADWVFNRPNEPENGRLFKLLAFAQWVNLQQ
jgi:asparagine synthase (glutamine-hydrolysing)